MTCLGIFLQLMSFKLTTTRRVRNSALEVGLSYNSDLSRVPVGKRIDVDKRSRKDFLQLEVKNYELFLLIQNEDCHLVILMLSSCKI